MIEKLILNPFQRFVRIESFSGMLLFIATIIALIWANSPLAHTYESLWQYNLGISTKGFELNKPLILWINDALMAVFFFLIGLEIKRELMIGELNTVKKASFPLFAAIGGMLAPLSIYLILNQNPASVSGWGIPMATDIAFTLAILKVLGKRVPLSLKIFLTAFAIVDDIGAVLVIALFYSESVKWILIAYAMIPMALLIIVSTRGFYNKYLWFTAGAIVWYLFLKAGIHPTVAGVMLAFAVPIRRKISLQTYTEKLNTIVDNFRQMADSKGLVLTESQIEEIDKLEDWTHKVQSPLQHLEHKLHNLVSYIIMPLFALANAGVNLGSGMQLETDIVRNIAIALVVGNLIGVCLMSFIGIKFKIASLPEDINPMQVVGVAFLAGVGFTMSIFIANLAFHDPVFIDSAKIGILIGSFVAGLIGYTILRFQPIRE